MEGNVLFNDALNTFYYGYMASDIWLKTILIVRKETRCCHIGYSFRLTARVLLYAPSHRQDSTYHSLCYTSRGALAGTRNSSMGPPWRIDPTTHCTMSERSYHGATSRSCWMEREIAQWVHHEGSIRRPITPWANALTTELHLAPKQVKEPGLWCDSYWVLKLSNTRLESLGRLLTCVHPVGQLAHLVLLVGVDRLVAVDEGQVGLGSHVSRAAVPETPHGYITISW